MALANSVSNEQRCGKTKSRDSHLFLDIRSGWWYIVLHASNRSHCFRRAGIPRHVTQRGNNRQAVFFVDDDRRAYLGILAEESRRSKGHHHSSPGHANRSRRAGTGRRQHDEQIRETCRAPSAGTAARQATKTYDNVTRKAPRSAHPGFNRRLSLVSRP